MPAVINICANLLLGTTFVLALRHSQGIKQEILNWPLLTLLAFEALVVTPVATYLFRFYPQWSMLYWFDPQIYPEFDSWIGWLSAGAIALNFIAVLAGYFAGWLAIVHRQRWLAITCITLALTFVLYITFAYGDRIALIGDYDTFWQGQAIPIIKRQPGWIGISLYVFSFLFVLWLHTRFGDRDPSFL